MASRQASFRRRMPGCIFSLIMRVIVAILFAWPCQLGQSRIFLITCSPISSIYCPREQIAKSTPCSPHRHSRRFRYHVANGTIRYHRCCNNKTVLTKTIDEKAPPQKGRANNYLFRKFLKDIVAIPKIFDFNCSPLSEVNIIGFSALYFNATDRIILSGERLSKSSGSNDVSANS